MMQEMNQSAVPFKAIDNSQGGEEMLRLDILAIQKMEQEDEEARRQESARLLA